MRRTRPTAILTALVLLTGATAARGQALRTWTLVPDVRFGDAATGPATLSSPMSLTVGPNGDVVAFDYPSRQIVPMFAPPVRSTLVGRDGSVWLQRERVAEGGRLWNVIDAAGERVAHLSVPSGVRVLYADMDQVLGVVEAADGRSVIARYRVQR